MEQIMKFLKYSVTAVFLILALFACNLPTAEQLPPPSDAQTAAALTVQALLTVPVTPSATEPQSVIPVTPSATATTLAATITPTYSTPMLTVKEQTNCRTGPGEAYQIVFTYLPNKKLEILGRYDQGNFWLVKSAESPGGQCWLWGEYVEVTGSYWAVSSVTPPPTATKAPPNAPTYQKWDYFCTYNGVNSDINVTLIWTDHSDNETGYRVIRDGQMLVELPPNSTTYTDKVAVDSGESATYRIDAYNATGTTSTSTISLKCE
jgi:hypothetical protein